MTLSWAEREPAEAEGCLNSLQLPEIRILHCGLASEPRHAVPVPVHRQTVRPRELKQAHGRENRPNGTWGPKISLGFGVRSFVFRIRRPYMRRPEVRESPLGLKMESGQVRSEYCRVERGQHFGALWPNPYIDRPDASGNPRELKS